MIMKNLIFENWYVPIRKIKSCLILELKVLVSKGAVNILFVKKIDDLAKKNYTIYIEKQNTSKESISDCKHNHSLWTGL